MFVTLKYSGYNRHGEQSAAGLFLILMQPDIDSTKYPARSNHCTQCGATLDEHIRPVVGSCPNHGIAARLRALCNSKPEVSLAKQDQSQVDEILKAERHFPGCAECDAHREYISHCLLFKPTANHHPIRAIVRYVRMRQLGHFMIGSARIGKTRITLSGSYGSDGLPKTVPDEVYEAGTPLPQELYDAWNKGGGWNSAGNEREAMEKWAKQNLITNKSTAGRK